MWFGVYHYLPTPTPPSTPFVSAVLPPSPLPSLHFITHAAPSFPSSLAHYIIDYFSLLTALGSDGPFNVQWNCTYIIFFSLSLSFFSWAGLLVLPPLSRSSIPATSNLGMAKATFILLKGISVFILCSPCNPNPVFPPLPPLCSLCPVSPLPPFPPPLSVY